MEALVFWIFAVGLVGSALAVVINRNPVASAMCLVATFLFLAALFVTLEAFFLAMVQIIVYAGAVMVLFLFIIMLLDIRAESQRPIPWAKTGLVALLAASFFFIFDHVLTTLPEGGMELEWGGPSVALTAKELGRVLFSKYLLPFEITAFILLVATIGVVHLSRRPPVSSNAKGREETS